MTSVSLQPRRFYAVDRALMRAIDLGGATLLLVLTSPLMAMAFIGIRLTSPGPVFFRAQRAGVNGETFVMYKFRSMHLGADRGSPITRPDDDRVFPLGRFLRASKIDELPQLLNILMGDMAFVGPRPEDPRIVAERYTERMRETLAVRPGLTSPGTLHYMRTFASQVTNLDPERSYLETILAEKLSIDRQYLERQSITTDLVLIVRTAWRILSNLVSGRHSCAG